MDKKLLQGLLWFLAGFGLAAVLILGLGAARFLPASVALALLSFACGVVAMQFLALWKAEKAASAAEDWWLEEYNKLRDEKSELEEDKREWEGKKKFLSEAFKHAAVAEPLETPGEEGGGGRHESTETGAAAPRVGSG
jgi:hypothetical protein